VPDEIRDASHRHRPLNSGVVPPFCSCQRAGLGRGLDALLAANNAPESAWVRVSIERGSSASDSKKDGAGL
jgi:hypothetical protein